MADKPDSPNRTPRLRVLLGSAIAMGPGKAELLKAIERTGSISKAAKAMGMSYRRAWDLVDTMNSSFKAPLVEASRGGSGGGGARLTDGGKEALQQFTDLEDKAANALKEDMKRFGSLLKEE
ncbi:winged helix-turn-helix domain-containing protein [Rhodovibrionaceae bacterium A322]